MSDLTEYADKEPTELHEHFADWIKDKTGYDPTRARSKEDAFLRGVQLGTLLRSAHQKSPENIEAREAREAARQQAAQERAERQEEQEEQEEEQPKPAKRAAAKKAAPAKKAATAKARKRGPRAASEDAAAEAAF